MTKTSVTLIRLALATATSGMALFLSVEMSPESRPSFVSSAQARIGRPLTPMSYAGVARRTTRRAVAAGAVVGAGAAVVYSTPSCVQTQVVDAYGRVVTVCR